MTMTEPKSMEWWVMREVCRPTKQQPLPFAERKRVAEALRVGEYIFVNGSIREPFEVFAAQQNATEYAAKMATKYPSWTFVVVLNADLG